MRTTWASDAAGSRVPGASGQVVVPGHVGEPAVGAQQVRYGRGVPVVVLDADHTAGSQQVRGQRHHRADHGQAVPAASPKAVP